jgi:hypothetical protein
MAKYFPSGEKVAADTGDLKVMWWRIVDFLTWT